MSTAKQRHRRNRRARGRWIELRYNDFVTGRRTVTTVVSGKTKHIRESYARYKNSLHAVEMTWCKGDAFDLSLVSSHGQVFPPLKDAHQERAEREGISRAEAKQRNFLEQCIGRATRTRAESE